MFVKIFAMLVHAIYEQEFFTEIKSTHVFISYGHLKFTNLYTVLNGTKVNPKNSEFGLF